MLAEMPAHSAQHVDTWTAEPQARLAAVRYMARTAASPTFSGARADRWSERDRIGVLIRMRLRRRVAP